MAGTEAPTFWVYFWGGVLAVGLTLFSVLSVVVSIGAVADIYSWLKNAEEAGEPEENAETSEAPETE